MLKSTEIRNALDLKLEEAEKIANTASKEDLAKHAAEIKDLMAQLNTAETLESAQRTIKGGTPLKTENKTARTLGRKFVNFVKEKGITIKSENFEFQNLDTDPHLTTDNSDYQQFSTELDNSFVQAPKMATILDIVPQANISKPTVTYFIKKFDDAATIISKRKDATAEGGQKNRRHYTKEVTTDNAGKFTGLTDISEEMLDDLDFIASEIDIDLAEDVRLDGIYQILHGSGTTPNIKGILNREGIQKITSPSLAQNEDTLFKGINKIETITPYKADYLIMNPEDYEVHRLAKDENGQYKAGGMYQNSYGNTGLKFKPDVWTLPTITDKFMPKGKALAFSNAGWKLFNYGGEKIARTDSNKDNFEKDMVTLRRERRIVLQVKIPQCFCEITLAAL